MIIGQKISVTKMSYQSLDISVKDPQKVEGGFFSKSYITFLVTTKPFNFSVRRRYSDFEWLRDILISQFPACFVPPIASKNYSMRFDENFIQRRMRYLEKFLRSIENNSLLCSSIFVYDFLTTSEEEFPKKKKEHNLLKAPTTIDQFKSLDGSVRVLN